MLARWLRFKEESAKGPKKRRPYLAELCKDLHECEMWRTQIIKDISRKVSEIQNASLSENRIRDLNDRINKLFREKRHWEKRIRDLGGKNYIKNDNIPVGYRYFGVAKDLPGVKELLLSQKNNDNNNDTIKGSKDLCTGKKKKSKSEMLNNIDINYYGLGLINENNSILMKEKLKEQKIRNIMINNWITKHENNDSILYNIYKNDINKTDNIIKRKNVTNNEPPKKKRKIFDVNIPTQQEIDQIILDKQKKILLNKFKSSTFIFESQK